jgi:hypothetical protein
MTPADAAELLALAAAFDRRKIGKADAIAWADALADLGQADCAEAIRAHFRDSTDYLMPAHVRRGVKALRADRIRAASSGLLEPPNVNPNDVVTYLAEGRARRRALASGQQLADEPAASDYSGDVKQLLEQTIAALPKVPRLAPGDIA